jgi:radical SAM superfamily enzyme YgiQ (UPF0313 family)
MSHDKLLLIANISHNYNGLKAIAEQKEKNQTELFGSGNLPLGILSIDSYVRHNCNRVDTRIIDLNTQFLKKIKFGNLDEQLDHIVENFETFLMEEIGPICIEFKPQIIAISTLFDKSIPTLFELSNSLRTLMPDALIIAGGHPANNLYEKLLGSCSSIDAICLGEGEIPFFELMNSSNPLAYIQDSPYFMTLNKCGKSQQDIRNVNLTNLDDIPMLDYDRFLKQYGNDILCLHNNVLDSAHAFNRQAILMTSRGCPYKCIFCASQLVHGHKMRANSLERVKSEIDYWVSVHKVTTLGIMDDHFLFDIPRAIAIIDYAGSHGLDIRFLNGLAIAPINQELVDCFVRNRIKEVHLALESGSDRVLKDIIKKPLSIKHANEVFNLFKGTDIFVKLYLVVGFPNETKEDIDETLQFLRKTYFHWALISPPTPISGSGLFKQMKETGLLMDYDFSNVSFFNNVYENKQLSNEMNGDIKYTVNLDVNFVNNPYMRLGEFQLARERFESLLISYPDHAFALYYLIKCLEAISEDKNHIEELKHHYNRVIAENSTWKQYALYFHIKTVI